MGVCVQQARVVSKGEEKRGHNIFFLSSPGLMVCEAFILPLATSCAHKERSTLIWWWWCQALNPGFTHAC